MFPVIGALIGWITNLLAIRLLFRPQEPVRVMGKFVIQGLLHRRKKDIALTLGEIVEAEFLSRDRILAVFIEPEFQDELVDKAAVAAERAIQSRLPVFIPSGVRNLIINFVKDATRDEVQRFTIKELPGLIGSWLERFDIAAQVRERIEALDFNQLEELAVRLARRELKHIELLGAVLGFVVGLVQAVIFQSLN